jgi:CBS domain-containing protein/PII-like signaling protein
MNDSGQTQQLWIYIGEGDSLNGRSVAQQIVEALRDAGCPGATVLRGVAGFGTHQVIHSEVGIEIASHLPLLITLIDRADRIALVMPRLRDLVREGMIAVSPVEVVFRSPREGGPFPRHLSVADVMTRDVARVAPDDPVRHILGLMIERGVRAVPVVDAGGHVAGIITDSDLLRRGAQSLSLRLQRILPLSERAAHAEALAAQPQAAADLMTPSPQTISEHMPLAQAAAVMVGHDRKRMPVVNYAGQLVGMVSRYDLLRTVAEGLRQRPDENLPIPEGAPSTVGDVMIVGPKTVRADAPVAEALDALLQSPMRRVAVVDENGGVLGIVTDGDVLRRASRRLTPSALSQLAAWLSAGKGPSALQVEGYGRLVSETMSSPAITVRADAPVSAAIRLMMAHKIKALPAVDADGKFVGLIGRAGVLTALGGRS